MYRAYERRCSVGTSVRVPESQEGARESLKGPVVVANDVLFLFIKSPKQCLETYCFCSVIIFLFLLLVFSTHILNFEKSFTLSPGPQSSLVPSCNLNFCWRPSTIYVVYRQRCPIEYKSETR